MIYLAMKTIDLSIPYNETLALFLGVGAIIVGVRAWKFIKRTIL